MTPKELLEAVRSGEVSLAEHPQLEQQFRDYLSSLAQMVKLADQPESVQASLHMDECIDLWLRSADKPFRAAEEFYQKARRNSLALADSQQRDWGLVADDEVEEHDDNFQPCDNCDLPDACSDFGCAIKTGIRKQPVI